MNSKRGPITEIFTVICQILVVSKMFPHEIPGFISFRCWDFQRISSTILVTAFFGIPIYYISHLIDKKKKYNASLYGSTLILLILYAFAILMPVASVSATGNPVVFHGISIGETPTKEILCHEKFTIKSIEKRTQFELCWNKSEVLYDQKICEFHAIQNHYGIYVQTIKEIPDTVNESYTLHTGFFQDYTKEIEHYDSLKNSVKNQHR